jgi:SAM-dependent methyltransferase
MADTTINHDATQWERAARTRWGRYITQIEAGLLEQTARHADRATLALEIGAEGGRWTGRVIELGWRVICTDVDPDMVQIRQARHPKARCVLVRLADTTLPCESSAAGLVLCIEVGPVMTSDWFPGEALRVLKPGGLLLGVFWNRLSIRGMLAHWRAVRAGQLDYYRLAYVPWRRNMQAGGLSFLYEEGICWFPFARTSNARLIPFFVWLESVLGLRRAVAFSPWIVFLAQKQPPIPRHAHDLV